MKDIGILRPVDKLGRVVIPKEVLKKYDITPDVPVEYYVDGDKIVLKKYVRSCIFCGTDDNLEQFMSYNVCYDCRKSIVREEKRRKNRD